MNKAMRKIGHFINGAHDHDPDCTRLSDVYNPATGEVQAQLALAGGRVVQQACTAAAQALDGWANTPASTRVQVLFGFRERLYRHEQELAELVSREHGKTLMDAKGSVRRGIEVVEFACGIPSSLQGAFSEQVSKGVDCYNIRQPVGVCVGITPFNFPVMVPLWMFPVAIACGNTFVLKPSEKTPSAALRMAELMKEAGLPDGVLNVVMGDAQTVNELITHPEVAAVSFVGSTRVGEQVHRTASHHGKRVQALCGAKNHLVVLPDADLDMVEHAIMGSAYGSAGERCMAISVIVSVGDQVADAICERLAASVKALRVGPYDQSDVEMGPLVTPEHLQRVLQYVATGVEEGAELVVDGRSQYQHQNGFYMGGCFFDHVRESMRIYTEEIFGPVLCQVRVQSMEQALKLVNDHEYGNGTAIFTRNGGSARDYARHAKAGMVGINVPIPVPAAYFSFGGWKRSLFGDHAIHGQEGVRFYTKMKTVTSRWPKNDSSSQFYFTSSSEHR